MQNIPIKDFICYLNQNDFNVLSRVSKGYRDKFQPIINLIHEWVSHTKEEIRINVLLTYKFRGKIPKDFHVHLTRKEYIRYQYNGFLVLAICKKANIKLNNFDSVVIHITYFDQDKKDVFNVMKVVYYDEKFYLSGSFMIDPYSTPIVKIDKKMSINLILSLSPTPYRYHIIGNFIEFDIKLGIKLKYPLVYRHGSARLSISIKAPTKSLFHKVKSNIFWIFRVSKK